MSLHCFYKNNAEGFMKIIEQKIKSLVSLARKKDDRKGFKKTCFMNGKEYILEA